MTYPVVKISAVLLAASLAACASMNKSSPAAPAAAKASSGKDFAREALPANDGWAASGNGVDGGSKAAPDHTFTVTNRAELVKALSGTGGAPTLVLVKGRISLNTDDKGKELTEKDYAGTDWSFDEYTKAYAPATWNIKLEKGRPVRDLTGPLEEARQAAQKKQKAVVVVNVPSNVSIIGVGSDAKIVHGNLMIGAGTENVIIRNITFEDSFDLFPGWDPGDSWKVDKSYPGCQDTYVDAKTGPQLCPGGRWNSEYDNISINGGKRVWIDHCSFSDGDRPDKLFPPNFPFPHNEVTQKIQHHDGFVDITNAADLVTLSYNVFRDHDKTSLIGSSDNPKTPDAGALRVTYHHNLFDNSGQRLPRVRFGKVHAYNNYYSGDTAGLDDPKLSAYDNHLKAIKEHGSNNIFRGAFGLGKESMIYSENNYFDIKGGTPANIVQIQSGGTRFFDQGTMFNGKAVDALKEINAGQKTPLSGDVGWKPTLYVSAPLPAADVPAHVKANAGAGKL